KESVEKVFRLNSVTPKKESSVIESVKNDPDLGRMNPEKERDIDTEVPNVLKELLDEGSIETFLGYLYRGKPS
ncbi:MAG: hypothetical protein IT195_14475, partial [Microthrixaceae bacterium]|nr:hypothetical protein [Microthrixaceae bacterium]